MNAQNLLEGKKVLIVDDEEDILDTLEDLLPMCTTVRAANYEDAEALLKGTPFDLAILDIMGVSGYRLLEICVARGVVAVMLTAHAVTPEDVKRSFNQGAAYYIPKEEMADIETFLSDVLKAKQSGRNTWSGWYHRLSRFSERAFGKDWRSKEKDLFNKMTFHV